MKNNIYFVSENNTGGHTVALGVLSSKLPHMVMIKAKNVDEAIKKFEKHFDLDWNEQNSYEGNSCNCCGRRFTIECFQNKEKSNYDEYDCVSDTDSLPYYIKNGDCAHLEDAPTEEVSVRNWIPVSKDGIEILLGRSIK